MIFPFVPNCFKEIIAKINRFFRIEFGCTIRRSFSVVMLHRADFVMFISCMALLRREDCKLLNVIVALSRRYVKRLTD